MSERYKNLDAIHVGDRIDDDGHAYDSILVTEENSDLANAAYQAGREEALAEVDRLRSAANDLMAAVRAGEFDIGGGVWREEDALDSEAFRNLEDAANQPTPNKESE